MVYFSESATSKQELYSHVQRRLIAALLYSDAEANRVLELVSVEDFAEPAYETIFQAIIEVSRRNEDITAISVAHQLEVAGNLESAGGISELYLLRDEGKEYLLEAPASLYAAIIKESSAKTKTLSIIKDQAKFFKEDSGVSTATAIAELQGQLNSELYRLSDESTSYQLSEDFDVYLDVLRERELIAKENEGTNGLQGIPSLLPSLNYYTAGWLPGQMITVGARTGVGKALALDTPIITPRGWTTMGELSVGDEVFGRDGKPTKVVNATPVQYNRKCFRVTFSNGETIVADADHRWLTHTSNSRKAKNEKEEVRTTQEIFDTLRYGKDQRANHSIKSTEALVFNNDVEADLPIDPYLFGYWLGGGHSWSATLSFHDLRALDVIQNKHIPQIYKESSIEQRKELLRGLLDSDGTASKESRQFFSVTRKRLFFDALEIANSLGLVTHVTTKRVKGKTEETSIAYNFGFKSQEAYFKLPRKKDRIVGRPQREGKFYITKVEEVESVPVRCIQVDNEEHMYLAGKSMIPTHNTVFAVNCAVAGAQAGKSVLFFSLEMGRDELTDRIVSSTTGILLSHLRQGRLTDEEQVVLAQSNDMIQSMKIKIETEAKVTIDSIRAKALRQAQTTEGLDFIVIDYLQLITPAGRFSSRQEAVADISRNVKLLAKQLNVPIMVLVQVNREGKEDENPIPKLSQIRESGAIGQDSDIVVLLHRDEVIDDTIPHTLVLLEKNRNGESQKTIRCHSNLECSAFREVVRARDIERSTEADEEALADDFDLDEFSHLSENADDFSFDDEDIF